MYLSLVERIAALAAESAILEPEDVLDQCRQGLPYDLGFVEKKLRVFKTLVSDDVGDVTE